MKDLPLAFIDLETTGIDPSVHEILEIGLLRAKQTGDPKNPLVEVDRCCIQVIPQNIERADPKALAVNHYHQRRWDEAISFGEAAVILEEKMRGHIIVAQNVAFDVGFLMRAFERIGKSLDGIVHYHKLDLASLAMGREYWNPTYRRFTLNELAMNAGVENMKAHTALSDTVATFEIARKLLTRP